jgi:hypothetical protein
MANPTSGQGWPRGGADTAPPPASTGWTRPADWLPNDVPAGEQKVQMLVAVGDDPSVETSRVIAFQVQGAFTVNWGDGTAPQNFGTGTTASHLYDPAALAGTMTSDGWLQALVIITPQAGQNLTFLDLTKYYYGSKTALKSPVVEVIIGSTLLTNLILTTGSVSCPVLTRVEFKQPYRKSSPGGIFLNCVSLREVVGEINAAGNDASSMFMNCPLLTKFPRIVLTGTGITANTMFNGCRSMVEPPPLEVAPGAITNMAQMFMNCSSMKRLPAGFSTQGVLLVHQMFADCSQLTALTGLDFSSVGGTTMPFTACGRLTKVQFQPGKGPKSTWTMDAPVDGPGLNAIYEALPVVTGQTITVTASPGSLGDDPTIATAKGWAVTGS